jgi:hypothetical protein
MVMTIGLIQGRKVTAKMPELQMRFGLRTKQQGIKKAAKNDSFFYTMSIELNLAG